MPVSFMSIVNRVWREHNRYAGDGTGGTGALPIGDPASGAHSPSKAGIREGFEQIETQINAGISDLDLAVTDATAAATAAATSADEAAASAAAAAAIAGFDGTATDVVVSPAVRSRTNVQTALVKLAADLAVAEGAIDALEAAADASAGEIVISPSGGDDLAAIRAAYATAYDEGKDLVLAAGDYLLSARLDFYERANIRPPAILPRGRVRLVATGNQSEIVRFKPDAAESSRPFCYGNAFGTAENPIQIVGKVTTFTGTMTSGSAVVTGIADTSILAVGMFVRDWTGFESYKIPGNSFKLSIVSIDSPTQITLSAPVTGSRTATLYATANATGLNLSNTAHGKFFAFVRDVYQTGIRTECAVLCHIQPWVSANAQGFNMDPSFGLFVDDNDASSVTTACIFDLPILEGCSSVGIRVENGHANEFRLGTAEFCEAGVLLNVNARRNVFRSCFMEGNDQYDITDVGIANVFEACEAKDGACLLQGRQANLRDCFLGPTTVSAAAAGTVLFNNIYRGAYANSGSGTISIGCRSEANSPIANSGL